MTDRCSTCTHWEPPESADLWGDWMPMPEEDFKRWGVCKLIDLPGYGEKVSVSAYTKDGSGYRADLHTRSDFGCVLHQPATESCHRCNGTGIHDGSDCRSCSGRGTVPTGTHTAARAHLAGETK